MDGPAISEEEHEVTLHAERPVVAKEAVPVERVRLDKETVTEQAHGQRGRSARRRSRSTALDTDRDRDLSTAAPGRGGRRERRTGGGRSRTRLDRPPSAHRWDARTL